MTTHNFKDFTGVRLDAHKLTVIEKAGVSEEGHTLWLCQKDNGKLVTRLGWYLTKYRPKIRVPKPKKAPKKQDPEYDVWSSMKRRCLNPKAQAYAEYGGRGITVCESWQESYKAFLEDMGMRPSPDHSLDRKDNEGPYTKENCRWATCTEQNRNVRSNRRITWQGETLTVAGWAERTGLTAGAISQRLKQSLPIEDVLRPGRKKQIKSGGSVPIFKDGRSRHYEYKIWLAMVQRCTNSKHPAWNNYGGRGIKVCDRWVDFWSFVEDMGPCPDGHSLERKRVNEGYGPDNCVWATTKEQGRNTRRNRLLTSNGVTLCLAEWAERLGVKYDTIRSRLRMGWSDERALTFKK